ncbi:MAG: hypothetical protein LQ338_006168 [Usnochroma carphineum]|nr:MAG: hypothetical protein LQ338_006168 [Usnochroma carphineum]
MRTSIILTAVLAGGALATPVKKWLEERALVVDWVTTTTVVWVTEGETATAAPLPYQKAAVAPAYVPHYHAHAHAHPAAPPVTTPAPAAAPPPASSKPAAPAPVLDQKAPAPVLDQKAPQPPAQQPTPTSTPPAPAPSPNTNSDNSGSTEAPTSYPADLDTTSDVYKALVLQHHNIHRANHSADDLVWDDTLAGYAEQSARTCVWGHNLSPGGGGYGQNIAAGTEAGQIAKVLTGGFYNNEMMDYPKFGVDSPDMTNFEKWGHFSQMVWKGTQKVGCYTFTCSPAGAPPLDCNPATGQSYLKNTGCGNGGMEAIFTVCNYSPAGNIRDNYSNVGACGSKGLVMTGDKGVTGL